MFFLISMETEKNNKKKISTLWW